MNDDANIYSTQGYGRRLGFGRRAALVIVDFTKGFANRSQFGGGNIATAIEHTVPLLAIAREQNLPIVFSRHAYAADGSDWGLFTQKNENLKMLTTESPTTEIVDELAPRLGEMVLCKRHPSVFFGTDLAGWLTMRGVDTLIVTGCTTSGCIRASVVDAMGYGLRPIVARECVGDRARGPHEANLFDLEMKYADVLSLCEVLDAIRQLNVESSRTAAFITGEQQR
jgi:maleamate amidohydrolase